MKVNNPNKTFRVLKIYEKLSAGDGLVRKELADYFDVSKKTIKRDIKEINRYFQEIDNNYHKDYINYDYQNKAYFLNHDQKLSFTQKEILAIVKVILESRAFCKEETEQIINKLINRVPLNLQSNIKEVIANELYHYTELDHQSKLLDLIWKTSLAVKENRVIKIKYNSLNKDNYVERKIEPQGLMFSEFYFYLIANHYEQKDDFKIVYRLDRIEEIEVLTEHFKVNYTDRFQEGEFRKRVQFMYPGKLMKLKLKFWGKSIEAVLDRLPTAEIIDIKDGKYIIETEVFGKGIKMWLLSQGDKLEVLEPKEFREEFRNLILKMKNIYLKGEIE
jgi:predicted DNA-binding transcriptional regulator YafY